MRVTRSDQILQRAKQLQESRIDIQLFNLTPEGQDFSMDFWGGIVSEFDDSLGPQSTEPLRIQVRHRPRAGVCPFLGITSCSLPSG